MKRRYQLWMTVETPKGVLRRVQHFLARPCNAFRQAVTLAEAAHGAGIGAKHFVMMQAAPGGYAYAVPVVKPR